MAGLNCESQYRNYHHIARQRSVVVFLYFTALVTNHVNECQQCQNEHSKCHKVFEIKSLLFVFPFFVHRHHLHFMKIEASTLCGAAVLCPVFYHIFMHTTRGCIKCFMSNSFLVIVHSMLSNRFVAIMLKIDFRDK